VLSRAAFTVRSRGAALAVRLAPALLASLLCASCLVGPDYKAARTTLPAGWSARMENGLEIGSEESLAVDRAWWQTLGDPQLDGLVARAVENNLDVHRAIARIREARAARQVARASFFPTVDTEAGYQRRQTTGTRSSSDAFSAGFDSSWEIDLFGGIRRSSEQATAEFEAAGADLSNVLVSVVAEVARNYVDMRSLQARVAIAVDNAESQKHTLEIAEWRYRAGLAGALDVEQATYNLAQTRSRIPALEIDLAAARNRIAVLLGASAGSLDAELAVRKPVPVPTATVAVGLPVDLLRRRPDVAAAERRLAAATAAIGVATADLYPKLTLTGTFSVAASDFASLDSAAARGFAVGPALRWNLFDAGRLRGIVKQRSAEADAALADWQAAVLSAGEEAENALVAFAKEQQRRDRLREAELAASKAQDLARLQYQNGLSDFQTVLEAERSRLVFEESLAESEASVTTNLVALYKALGGGWQVADCTDTGCRDLATDVEPAQIRSATQATRSGT